MVFVDNCGVVNCDDLPVAVLLKSFRFFLNMLPKNRKHPVWSQGHRSSLTRDHISRCLASATSQNGAEVIALPWQWSTSSGILHLQHCLFNNYRSISLILPPRLMASFKPPTIPRTTLARNWLDHGSIIFLLDWKIVQVKFSVTGFIWWVEMGVLVSAIHRISSETDEGEKGLNSCLCISNFFFLPVLNFV